MSQSKTANRRIVLNSRPVGAPTANDFRLETGDVPTPGAGQVLLRTVWLSLDPYMRGRMSDAPSYAPPVQLGDVMVGGTISRVVSSNLPAFREGDLVVAAGGWQDYALSDGSDLIPLGRDFPHPSRALGVLGMPGFTAYTGLLTIGEPKAGETVVVAAASGAVGAVVGQIAKLKGCRVIGVAGGADKCAYVTGTLGFDACIDHRDPAFASQLKAACPNGIDVYFENVGGAVFDAVWPLLNNHARVPVCGLIAHYNDTALPAGPDRLPKLMTTILSKRIRMQGFIILDYYATGYAPFLKDMSEWVAQGSVKVLEDVIPDLTDAPAALIGLFAGKNFGKVVVRVGPDELA
ncbi:MULTISPECIES: NADP-dependent oxidoreductase [Burkholderia]|uniref:NADP-dependent oxidoreductase n=1 Tax=Burkholderia TaxID=32008 RepID=UPI00080B7B39|nr:MULTISPECIES: NADP-dependent oxidoreductase [Burkholderia]MCA8477233.1 NADP-dependent oxidoreductase [Burkholderia multivorans]MDR9048859.1 NADPH-dependent curcumin reductase [Burkholderia multivorans]MDR9059310.1 NADPH-dependent curcumin reductase [Burkholderia multivorans]MDR9064586.1 NADPH-dependent curcumin reductase [Burkholderia multivorans]MDR9067401.1 NADPH-dependent curcumin reductase [Burkholderia multivorans]